VSSVIPLELTEQVFDKPIDGIEPSVDRLGRVVDADAELALAPRWAAERERRNSSRSGPSVRLGRHPAQRKPVKDAALGSGYDVGPLSWEIPAARVPLHPQDATLIRVRLLPDRLV
jgi:hypothetical protein